MRRAIALVSGLIALLLGVAVFTPSAEAIPAWARKYGTSCATCHEAFPRLNATGEAFRLNGYRFQENDEAYVRVDPTSLGDPAYKRVFPDAVWPSDLPGAAPIALRFTSDFQVAVGDEDLSNSFRFPSQGKLLAGGTLGESVSFFAEIEFDPASGESDFGAFLNFEDVLSDTLGENLLNLRHQAVCQQSRQR